MLFCFRLRRRARLRRDLQDLEEISPEPQLVDSLTKRERSSSSSGSSSPSSSLDIDPSLVGERGEPAPLQAWGVVLPQASPARAKRVKAWGGLASGFLLR